MRSFNQYVQDADRKNPLFVRQKFNIGFYANKSRESNIRSSIARIKNQFVKAMNEHDKFPKFIIVVLDDDLIQQTKYTDQDTIGSVIKPLIEWLFREVSKLLAIRKDQLPKKAIKLNYPKIFWVEAPQHVFFKNNLARRKFNSIVQSTAALYSSMKIIRMKKFWDAENRNLFRGINFTAEGLLRYWESIDNAKEFNENLLEKSDKQKYGKQSHIDKYHWQSSYKKKKFDNRDLRFKLPNPDAYC